MTAFSIATQGATQGKERVWRSHQPAAPKKSGHMSSNGAGCPDEWSAFGGACYRYVGGETMTHNNCAYWCDRTEPSSTMPCITSPEESAFVASLVDNDEVRPLVLNGDFDFAVRGGGGVAWIGNYREPDHDTWDRCVSGEGPTSGEGISATTFTNFLDYDQIPNSWFGNTEEYCASIQSENSPYHGSLPVSAVRGTWLKNSCYDHNPCVCVHGQNDQIQVGTSDEYLAFMDEQLGPTRAAVGGMYAVLLPLVIVSPLLVIAICHYRTRWCGKSSRPRGATAPHAAPMPTTTSAQPGGAAGLTTSTAAPPPSQACRGCGQPIPADFKFCNRCGTANTDPCTHCGHGNPVGFRFCMGCGQPRAAAAVVAAASPETPASAVTSASPVRQRTKRADAMAVAKLQQSEISAKALRRRVSRTITTVGWLLFAPSLIPQIVLWIIPHIDRQHMLQAFGTAGWYQIATPWGVIVLLLTIRPTDEGAIRRTLKGVFVTGLSFAFMFFWMLAVVTITGAAVMFAVVFAVIAASLAMSGFACYAGRGHHAMFDKPLRILGVKPPSEPMQPRRQLQVIWALVRCAMAGYAIVCGLVAFLTSIGRGEASPHPDGAVRFKKDDDVTASIFVAESLAIAALVSYHKNRGRVMRWLHELSNLGKHGEAASVAALLGTNSASETLALAMDHFRGLPLASLTREELAKNTPDPQMFEKSVPTKFGEVHAFLSHSWSDKGDSKFDAAHEWAGDEARLVWLDKACLDQNNIKTALACLPVFLAGCQELVLLIGPTYTTRLWCVMELFVFSRMGGTREDMVIKLLDDASALAQTLAKFDAGKARCYLDRDRQKLLAVIEASFGSFYPFNRLVRASFAVEVRRLSVNSGSNGAVNV